MAKLIPFDQVDYDPQTVITVGSFDGVHLGHVALVGAVANAAKQLKGRSVIVTFDPHPREIISPGKGGIHYLTTLKERCRALAEFGIDELVVIAFDRDFSLLSSDDFINLLRDRIGIAHYVIGYDHHFGKDREGSLLTLSKMAEAGYFTYEVVQEQHIGSQQLSSSRIRKILQQEGDVSLVKELLGRTYSLSGTVIHGEKRGRKIGYPTANIQAENPKKVIPKSGVYAVDIRLDGMNYSGMMNIGHTPTFEFRSLPSLEVHIFDFHRDVYGKRLEVLFKKRIRDEQRFEGVEALVEQLKKDAAIAKGF